MTMKLSIPSLNLQTSGLFKIYESVENAASYRLAATLTGEKGETLDC